MDHPPVWSPELQLWKYYAAATFYELQL